jgi:hypothetical protein
MENYGLETIKVSLLSKHSWLAIVVETVWTVQSTSIDATAGRLCLALDTPLGGFVTSTNEKKKYKTHTEIQYFDLPLTYASGRSEADLGIASETRDWLGTRYYSVACLYNTLYRQLPWLLPRLPHDASNVQVATHYRQPVRYFWLQLELWVLKLKSIEDELKSLLKRANNKVLFIYTPSSKAMFKPY